ncbi:MAG: hypothetical protein KAQ91_06640 [Methylococcales bacterium]|nr:hypothetical protein [Methylococcales bacterium]
MKLSITTILIKYNYQDLAVKYHRSALNIYTITKVIRKLQVRKHQSDLFPLAPEHETKNYYNTRNRRIPAKRANPSRY